MFTLINFLYNLFTNLVIISFVVVAILYACYCLRSLFQSKKLRIYEWILFFFSDLFLLSVIITKLFFPEIYGSIFTVLALLFITIVLIWARYDDKRTGKRWWNW